MNGHAHIGGGYLRHNAAVRVFDHGVNAGLRVNHHFDFGWREIEKPTSFDNFETFVHQRCGIDCDAITHLPCWMPQSLFGRNIREQMRGRCPKRSTGSRENQPCDFRARASAETLVSAVVFTVDGEQLRAVGANRIHDQPSSGNERFFVGEPDAFPRARRFEGRFQSADSNDCRDYGVYFRGDRDFNKAARTGDYLRPVRLPQMQGDQGFGE